MAWNYKPSEGLSVKESFNAHLRKEYDEEDRLRNTFHHVKCEKPWSREFITRGHRYEFCDVIEMEVNLAGSRVGEYMIARDKNGREFIAIARLGHYMEADSYDLDCSRSQKDFYLTFNPKGRRYE